MRERRTGTQSSTDPVHTITSTQGPLADDIDRRAKRYLYQMSLRTACFIGAVLTWGRVPTAVSVALLVGAVVLPYIAVVLANAGRERPERPDPMVVEQRQIAAEPTTPSGAGAVPAPGVVRPGRPGGPVGRTRPGSPGPIRQTRPTGPTGSTGPFGPSRPTGSTRPAQAAGPAAAAGSGADDATDAGTAWTDPPWDDPRWRDLRTEDPTGTPPDGGSGRG